jgi:hypothetical protein
MKVKEIIEMKLGAENLHYFEDLSTTSKNEAVNRSIKHSLPSNMTFARTGVGRVHSAVLKSNNGLLKSTAMKLKKLNCSFPQVTQKIIRKYTKQQERAKEYRKHSQKRREFIKKQKIKDYYRKTRLEKTNNDEYLKFQLDEDIDKKTRTIVENFDIDNIDLESLDLTEVEEMLTNEFNSVCNITANLRSVDKSEGKRQRNETLSKKNKSRAATARIAKKQTARSNQCKVLHEHSYGKM